MSPSTLSRRLAVLRGIHRSPSAVALGRVLAAAMGLVSAPIIARSVGPDGRGVIAATMAASFIVAIIVSMGAPIEMRRRVAVEPRTSAIADARLLVVLASPLALVLGALSWFTLFAELSGATRTLAAATLVSGLAQSLWMLDNSIAIARRRYFHVLLLQTCQPGVLLIGAAGLAVTGRATVPALLGVQILGVVATAVAGRSLSGRSDAGPNLKRAITLWRSSLKYAGSSIAEAASNRLDQVLVLPLIGAAQAGLYSVAVTIGVLPLTLGHALAAAEFSSMAADASPEARRATQRSLVRASVGLAALLSLVLAATVPVLVPWIFGKEFTGSVLPTVVALAGSVALCAAYAASMSLAAQGSGKAMTVSQVASLVLGIGLLAVLGPLWGALGAAIASTVAYWALFAMLLRGLHAGPSWVAVGRSDIVHGVRLLVRTGG